MGVSNINLIRKSSGLPEYMIPLENQYRNLSILTLFVVFVAGALTLVAYLLFQAQMLNVTNQKNSATKRLEAQRTKENLYLAIKSRIGVVDKVMQSSHQKSVLIDDALSVAPPPDLQSVKDNEQGKLVTNYRCGSLEDCLNMSNTVINQMENNKISEIFMNNMSLGRDGISISFEAAPVWQQ